MEVEASSGTARQTETDKDGQANAESQLRPAPAQGLLGGA